MNGPGTATPTALDFLTASRRSEVLALASFMDTGRLVVAISNLIHALQRERGVSNLFLGAAGEAHGDRLAEMCSEADQQQRVFASALTAIDPDKAEAGASRLFNRLAFCVQTLDGLPRLREQVRAQALAPEEAVRRYSLLVRGLLAVVFEAAERAADPSVARTLVAMFNVMQGKELAGQERATGCAGFARGMFSEATCEQLLDLLDAQARCFDVFESFADDQAKALWQAQQDAPYMAQLERMRRLACTAPGRDGGRVTPEQGERWFALTTERIDALKKVEDHLQTRLYSECATRLAEARENLSRQMSQPVPEQAAGYGLQEGAELLPHGLGRSVIELVQSQAQRLQAMEDELNTTRAALEERRLLERAKALLIKHRGMTEEQAYRWLRQTAMNQSRRLVDVAKAIVGMKALWEK